MRAKNGVKFDGARGPILFALSAIEPVMENTGEYTVTSICDGTHSAHSLHYVGLAADIRTRHIPAEKVAGVALALRAALGKGYDVVVEKDHLHIEISDAWLAANGDPRRAA